MQQTVRMATVLFLTLGVAMGAGEPFEFGKERDWEFLNQAKFRGSLVKIEGGKVFIRMADGVVRELWPGEADGVAGSYLQRAMCKLPANPSRPAAAPGTGPLIDLSASDLPAGPLAAWKNAGRLGGSFTVMNQPPAVAQVQGRSAVVFAHSPWLLPLEFQTLVSDFYMPEAAAGAPSMTVVAWLCNTGPVVDRETFLCWGEKDCGELDTPDFSYGCYEAMQWYNERMTIPPARFPKLNRWHQLAFVVQSAPTEKNRCEMKLYVDGEPVTGKTFRRPAEKLLKNNLVFLGCAWEAWWGHAWATRPARPYTGAMAALKVYDRALTLAEIRQLDGKNDPYVPPAAASGATHPDPATGAHDVSPGIERLAWSPDPDAAGQVLYFGTDRDAVARGTCPSIRLKPHVEEAFVLLDLKLPRLQRGTTYYWRAASLTEAKGPAPAGEPWSFTTSPFDLEFDGPVSEPFPKGIRQDGFYSCYMDAGGYPIISPPGNEDVHMRAARHALRKLLDKRPDLVTALQSSNAACHLASREHPGWGWSFFTCSCYGSGEAILREGAILMHEMGHQFQMQGAEVMEPDFRQRLGETFNAARRERIWMGDYGGANMWENVAACSSWWINDMAQDEGDLRPREVLRRNDPRTFHLLEAYWPGDLMIDLHPGSLLRTDPAGNLLEWGNRGGIEYFKPNVGWRSYARSVGRFTPASGKPALRTVGGVSAVAFAGTDALAWDQATWDSLDGNRAWSVAAWAWRAGDAPGEQTLVEWAAPGSPGAKLCWGSTDLACQLPGGVSAQWGAKAAPGQWHHLVWTFSGGGVQDGPGDLCLYVDGKPAGRQRAKLALPPQAGVTIGRGFAGAIGHLRIYNYELHPLQIRSTWERESAAYRAESPAAAGRLLVNLDARHLAPADDPETWPLYPASLGLAHLRSWTNRGTLGGKFHNDAGDPSSRPTPGTDRGTDAVSFDGKSRMIGSFAAPAPAEGSIEMWVFPAGDKNGIAMQWGDWRLPAAALRTGAWQHVALIRQKGEPSLFVDGVRVPSAAAAGPAGTDRLILGGAWDGKAWTDGFTGAIAQFRVHEGILSPEQIRQNIAQSDILRPALPSPGPREEVVAVRQPALRWQVARPAGDTRCDVYLGTSETEIAAADRSHRSYLGVKNPGELKPALQPGTDYFWRVDSLDEKGLPRTRGSVWHFRTAAGLLINLDAAGLAAGPVKEWRSTGSVPCTFAPASERGAWRPLATTAEGRGGVDFSGRKSLVSTFVTPPALRGSSAFTVSFWAYCRNTGGLEREQTMLSWGRRPRDHVEFGWGSDVKRGAFVGGGKTEFGFKGPETQSDRFRNNAPLLNNWHHFAYTWDPSSRALRIYVDGRLNREDPVSVAVGAGETVCLGGVRTGRLVDAPFGGMLGEVAIADALVPEAEIAKLSQGVPAATVRNNWLVRLDAATLPAGPLTSWRNQGSLGGEFVAEGESLKPPRAQQVGGRAAVTFDGLAVLRSDAPTPPVLAGDRPFTVEMWVQSPKLADAPTVFALAPSVAMPSYPSDSNTCAANFNFGAAKEADRSLRPGVFSSGQSSRNVGWTAAAPPGGQWHHMAYVNSGGYRGTFRVYLDGRLANEHEFFTLDTIGGYPMHVGAAWNTARGAVNPFAGSLSRLRVYGYARTEQEIQSAVAEP